MNPFSPTIGPRKDCRFLLMVAAIFLSILATSAPTHALTSCMPTCSETDGRFIAIFNGPGFETLTPNSLNLRVVVPAGTVRFSVGIFDGDHLGSQNGAFHWDTGAGSALHRYTLLADPDRDNIGVTIFEVMAADLPDNEWADFDLNPNAAARSADGSFVYTLKVELLEDRLSANSFKVRSRNGIVEIDEVFAFIATLSTTVDRQIVFPNFDDTDGIDAADKIGANYNGTFTFFFEHPGNTNQLEIWDGDGDHGNFDGTDSDTDDPNTPNVVPAFAPPGSDVLPEGANPPRPFDDSSQPLARFESAVTYTIVAPDGEEYENSNPSGNREWERFVLSSATGDPAIADSQLPTIPAGTYAVRFEGLDLFNTVALRPPFPLGIRGEIRRQTMAPVVAQMGLVAIILFLALLGYLGAGKKAAGD